MKQKKEIEVVGMMIHLYCRKTHKTEKGALCAECASLLEYVKQRRNRCPWGDEKPFCANCKIHCYKYKPEMREKIAKVMRYAGPKMIFHHPIVAIKHLTETKRQKRKLKREGEEKADNV